MCLLQHALDLGVDDLARLGAALRDVHGANLLAHAALHDHVAGLPGGVLQVAGGTRGHLRVMRRLSFGFQGEATM